MNNYESKLIDNKKEQLRNNFEHQKVEYFNNLIKEKDKELEELKKPLIPSEITELISLLYKEHLSNKNKKRLENYITRLHNYNEHLLKTAVEKDYKLVEIENEIDKVKNADMTGGNLTTFIDKIENIINDDTPQENLYRYTQEKGFELVGDEE